MKLTEEQFCKMVQGWDGEPMDKIKQLELITFNGEELKEFIEHCIKFNSGVLADIVGQGEQLCQMCKCKKVEKEQLCGSCWGDVNA